MTVTTENHSGLSNAPRAANARGLRVCLLLLLFVLCVDASVARAQASAPPKEEAVDSVLTKAGMLEIVRLGDPVDMKMELRFKGKKVYDVEDMEASFVAHFRPYGTGELIVMSVSEGGTACPAQFQIIQVVSGDRVSITKEFGDCGDSPTITMEMLPEDVLTLRFQGYYRLAAAEEPGFKKPPPTTYVYRKGVLSELKAAPPKRRGK